MKPLRYIKRNSGVPKRNAGPTSWITAAYGSYVNARHMKYFFPHLLFGKREVYTKEIRKATLERIACLIKVCGFLMQTKTYVFWNREKNA